MRGDTEQSIRLDFRVRRRLGRIAGWESEAAILFIDSSPRSPEARAMLRCGRAWSKWAVALADNPRRWTWASRSNYLKGGKLTDLFDIAMDRLRKAYPAVGAKLPPEFQSG